MATALEICQVESVIRDDKLADALSCHSSPGIKQTRHRTSVKVPEEGTLCIEVSGGTDQLPATFPPL